MDLKPWNPWQELERTRSEVESLLDAALKKLRHVVPGRQISFVPAMDIIEAKDEYRLYVSLPGMLEEDIDITLEGSVLIVRGERESPFDPAQVAVHQRQWKHGYFERRVQLPERIDGESIRATYEAGVLTIAIPKSPPTPRPQEGEATSGAEEAPKGEAS